MNSILHIQFFFKFCEFLETFSVFHITAKEVTQIVNVLLLKFYCSLLLTFKTLV